MLKMAVSASIWLGALIIDEKTGINVGTLFVLLGGLWWLGRRLQFLEDFVDESRKWRDSISDEQAVSRKEREQILRHQEIARQRQELILKGLDSVEQARKLYGEVIERLDNMRVQIGDKQTMTK